MLSQLISYLNTKSHLVFDFDKTLAQMEIDWSDWYSGMQQVYANFEPDHTFRSGQSPHSFQNKMVQKHGQALRDKINSFNQEYESRHLQDFTPHQELVDLILNLSGHTLYLYSSNTLPTVTKGLDQMGITHKFSLLITTEDVFYIKPHPEGFDLLDEYHDHKEKFLMIGDSNADREASRAAGIDFLESNYFVKYPAE